MYQPLVEIACQRYRRSHNGTIIYDDVLKYNSERITIVPNDVDDGF